MSESRPLEGLRVIELGQLLAGPFAGTVLGYFGAEVIKVEPPTGDPIRQWREVRNGMSLWYHSLARNKKSVTLDLKSERGRELAFELLTKADVVIEKQFKTEQTHQGYIEPHACLAQLGPDGSGELWVTTQGHFTFRNVLQLSF